MRHVLLWFNNAFDHLLIFSTSCNWMTLRFDFGQRLSSRTKLLATHKYQHKTSNKLHKGSSQARSHQTVRNINDKLYKQFKSCPLLTVVHRVGVQSLKREVNERRADKVDWFYSTFIQSMAKGYSIYVYVLYIGICCHFIVFSTNI